MADRLSIANELDAALQLQRVGKLQEAATIFRRVHADNEDDANACYGLGTILMQLRKFDEAAELLGKAVRLEPDAPEIVFNHALVLEKTGHDDDARSALIRAGELASGDPVLLPNICLVLINFGLVDAALGFLSTVSAPTVKVLSVRAKAQSAKGDWGNAALTLGQATALQPSNPNTWRALSTAHGRHRDYAAALDAYERYLRLKSPDASDLLAHADLLFMARRPADAKISLDRAMEAGAEPSAAHLLAAKCARLDADYDSMREHLQAAIRAKPAFGEAWQLLLETEDAASLADFADRCAELADDRDQPARDRILLYLTAGRAYEKDRQYAKAFRQFENGNELQKQDHAKDGLRYDSGEVDRYAERILTECRAPFVGASASEPNSQPIFIVGMPRSGTTLVERILGGLDGVDTRGESESLEFIAHQYYWDLERGRVPPPRELDQAAWDALAAEYWRRCGIAPTRTTDKMPHNFWHLGIICAMFPASPIIYMRRDPRDVCLSIYSRMFTGGHRYATDLSALAHYYGVSVRLMEHWINTHPGRVLTVDYEALIADPERRTQEIAAHCGLEWSADCLAFHERIEPSYTFSEMQVREPLNTKGIGNYRNYEAELGPLFEALDREGLLPAG